MTSRSRPASWAFLARVCERTANSSCSTLETPKAAARRSALWPIVSDVENSATAGSYAHMKSDYRREHSMDSEKNETLYLWGKVCQPDTSNQTEPLAKGLGFVERQHSLPHLTAVTDRHVGHELHPSCHNCITLTSSNQTNSWRKQRRVRTGKIRTTFQKCDKD